MKFYIKFIGMIKSLLSGAEANKLKYPFQSYNFLANAACLYKEQCCKEYHCMPVLRVGQISKSPVKVDSNPLRRLQCWKARNCWCPKIPDMRVYFRPREDLSWRMTHLFNGQNTTVLLQGTGCHSSFRVIIFAGAQKDPKAQLMKYLIT